MNDKVISIREHITKPIHQPRGIKQIIRRASFALSKKSHVVLDFAGYANCGGIANAILGSLILEHGESKVSQSVDLRNAALGDDADLKRGGKCKGSLLDDANQYDGHDIKELNVIYLLALRASLRENDGKANILMNVKDQNLASFVKRMSLADIMVLAGSGVICYEPKFCHASLSAIDGQLDPADGLDGLLALVGR